MRQEASSQYNQLDYNFDYDNAYFTKNEADNTISINTDKTETIEEFDNMMKNGLKALVNIIFEACWDGTFEGTGTII